MGQGGSFEIGSQIFPDFVQAQTGLKPVSDLPINVFNLHAITHCVSAAFVQYAG